VVSLLSGRISTDNYVEVEVCPTPNAGYVQVPKPNLLPKKKIEDVWTVGGREDWSRIYLRSLSKDNPTDTF
jgi:hypothetical protein